MDGISAFFISFKDVVIVVDNAVKEVKTKLKEAVRLTIREQEVIGLIGDGFINKNM
jgi:ATP/maltotriose-dependent transcriptional regulator MalT